MWWNITVPPLARQHRSLRGAVGWLAGAGRAPRQWRSYSTEFCAPSLRRLAVRLIPPCHSPCHSSPSVVHHQQHCHIACPQAGGQFRLGQRRGFCDRKAHWAVEPTPTGPGGGAGWTDLHSVRGRPAGEQALKQALKCFDNVYPAQAACTSSMRDHAPSFKRI